MTSRLPSAFAAAVSVVVLAGSGVWAPPAFAEPPPSKSNPRGAETAVRTDHRGTSSGNTSADDPAIVQADYVVGRYLLPLAVGIAVVFALVLTLVLDPRGDGQADASETSIG